VGPGLPQLGCAAASERDADDEHQRDPVDAEKSLHGVVSQGSGGQGLVKLRGQIRRGKRTPGNLGNLRLQDGDLGHGRAVYRASRSRATSTMSVTTEAHRPIDCAPATAKA
jgi:hypothetical protein